MKGNEWMAVVEEHKSKFSLDAAVGNITAYSKVNSVTGKLSSRRGNAKELFLSKRFDRPVRKAAYLSKVMHESPRTKRLRADLKTSEHENKKLKSSLNDCNDEST